MTINIVMMTTMTVNVICVKSKMVAINFRRA